MGHDLFPRNKKLKPFHFSAGLWHLLLEQCGCLYPYISKYGKYYFVKGTDKRFKLEHNYPPIIDNVGFRVTAEEARIMARMARNFVAIQRTLDDSHFHTDEDFDKPEYLQPFPQKVSEHIVNKFEEFAEWAEKSGGFKVY